MYGQKKEEDVLLKHLREYRDGELGLYSNSWGNSLGREARLREQQRAQKAAQAHRAHLAAWDRQQAAQRNGLEELQDSSASGKRLLGLLGNAFLYLMAMAALGGFLNGLGLI